MIQHNDVQQQEQDSRQQELERQGWTRQFIADEPRLSEAVENYRELGLEVRLEPVKPGTAGAGCGECFKEGCGGVAHQVIYTRPTTE